MFKKNLLQQIRISNSYSEKVYKRFQMVDQ